MSNTQPIIGVLALQGAVQPHKAHIEGAGAEFRAVKTPAQFAEVDGFILPGGESTTMLKLIDRFELWEALATEFAAKPVWGICAGAILMAGKVYVPSKDAEQKSFGLLPISIERNGYGRQIDSQHIEVNGYPVSHIRAPVITDAGDCDILTSHDNHAIWVRKGQYMASSFHPEMNLNAPSPMHHMFVEMVRKS